MPPPPESVAYPLERAGPSRREGRQEAARAGLIGPSHGNLQVDILGRISGIELSATSQSGAPLERTIGVSGGCS